MAAQTRGALVHELIKFQESKVEGLYQRRVCMPMSRSIRTAFINNG